MAFSVKIGHGYDVHRLAEGRKLMLGGVCVPHDKGLLGHSDADVVLHAVMDAVLGALGEGDIGSHFPDTDNAYKDINSLLLVERVRAVMQKKGYRVGNVDVTVIAQKPRLASYLPAMKVNIAHALGCKDECVNVKATTEEHLGFTGREEGIAAHAVCLCVKE